MPTTPLEEFGARTTTRWRSLGSECTLCADLGRLVAGTLPNQVWGNKGQQVRISQRRGVQNQGELRD